MHEAWFAIPGDISTPTGGYRYDRRVMEELRFLGWNMRHLPLPGDFPAPSEASLRETERLLRTTPEGLRITGDDLLPVAVIAGPPAFDRSQAGRHT